MMAMFLIWVLFFLLAAGAVIAIEEGTRDYRRGQR